MIMTLIPPFNSIQSYITSNAQSIKDVHTADIWLSKILIGHLLSCASSSLMDLKCQLENMNTSIPS